MTIWFVRIALLLLPLLAFALFWRHARDHEEAQKYLLPALGLSIALSIVMLLIALALTQESTGKPGQTYVPAIVVDGKVVDGRFDTPEQPAGEP